MNGPTVLELPREPMPDIASAPHQGTEGTLDWVGMSEVHQPLRLRDGAATHPVDARASIYVDLGDPRAKGIHMSRLYLRLRDLVQRELDATALRALLEEVIASHADLSSRALLTLDFDLVLERPALLSDNSGFGSYPVSLRAEHTPDGFCLDLGVKVTYSSTCPCSAALARQLIQRQFDEDFGEGPVDAAAVRRWLGTEQGILATPHSQRSVADVTVRLARPEGALPVRELVDRLEEVLQTPVQTAVKREDEQEFALRNGRNLMFCEDAARRLKTALDADARFADFRVRVDHYESLHAHDATAVATKGVPNGFPPVA